MECHESKLYMSAYLDDECDEEMEAQLLDHLEKCARCQSHMEHIVADQELLEQMPLNPPHAATFFADMTAQILDKSKAVGEQPTPSTHDLKSGDSTDSVGDRTQQVTPIGSRFRLSSLAAAFMGAAAAILFFMVFEIRWSPFWEREATSVMDTHTTHSIIVAENYTDGGLKDNLITSTDYRPIIENTEVLLIRMINLEDPKELVNVINQLKKSKFLRKVDTVIATSQTNPALINDHLSQLRTLLSKLVTDDLSNPEESLKKIRDEVIKSGLIEKGRMVLDERFYDSI